MASKRQQQQEARHAALVAARARTCHACICQECGADYIHDVQFLAWRTAALLKDRTRRAIRDRHQAGESKASLADDFGVPPEFIHHLCSWQLFGDD